MPLVLNLLPKSGIRQLKFEYIYRLIKLEAIVLFSVIILVGVQIRYVKNDLNRSSAEITNMLEQNKQKHSNLITQIEEFNSITSDFKNIQGDFTTKSSILLSLFKLVPKGISFTTLNIKEDNQIEIQGKYTTRDNLLLFKTNLENSLLTEIEFPISNLLKQENGSFVLKGVINIQDK